MKTAVVILNYNTRDYLKRFLPGLVASCKGQDAQVIVADNASTDDSVALMQAEFPEVPLIQLDQNYGFTGGYNRALAQLEADYYLLINSDIEVPEGWLQPLVKWMDNHPDCGACGPKLLSYAKRDHFEYAGAAGGLIAHGAVRAGGGVAHRQVKEVRLHHQRHLRHTHIQADPVLLQIRHDAVCGPEPEGAAAREDHRVDLLHGHKRIEHLAVP